MSVKTIKCSHVIYQNICFLVEEFSNEVLIEVRAPGFERARVRHSNFTFWHVIYQNICFFGWGIHFWGPNRSARARVRTHARATFKFPLFGMSCIKIFYHLVEESIFEVQIEVRAPGFVCTRARYSNFYFLAKYIYVFPVEESIFEVQICIELIKMHNFPEKSV